MTLSIRQSSRAPHGLAFIAALLAGSAIVRPALAQDATTLPEINATTSSAPAATAASGVPAAGNATSSGPESGPPPIGIVGAQQQSLRRKTSRAHRTRPSKSSPVRPAQLTNTYGAVNAREAWSTCAFRRICNAEHAFLVNGRINDLISRRRSVDDPLQSIERTKSPRHPARCSTATMPSARHQYRDQDGAGGSKCRPHRRRRRFVWPARRQYFLRHEQRPVVVVDVRKRRSFGRLPRQQQARAAERRRRNSLRRAGPHRV